MDSPHGADSANETTSAEAPAPAGPPPPAAHPRHAGEHESHGLGGHQSFWLWVMCLTGVDYFSTLGYQPSIAFEATGRLAPLATLLLVFVTLFCALPVYSYVAGESYRGQGSIAMLERLVHGWTGKIMVLVLLGFAATDFVITKTLSAADAAKHLIANPLWEHAPEALQNEPVQAAVIAALEEPAARGQIRVTMILLVLLGGTFLRGFREVIGVAVVIVAAYLLLNLIVILIGLGYILGHPNLLSDWWTDVRAGDWYIRGVEHLPVQGHDAWAIAAVCFLFFPKLALGLSGFETGVAVMPLVRGGAKDESGRPIERIQNTRKLLVTAAVIMSFFLLGSSLVTALLIPHGALERHGAANERALAYLAHGESPEQICALFGRVFGTIYDIATVAILWFAGASAMSGLLNLVPQYLPRYGMAPEWATATKPMVFLFTAINLFVTWFFNADVDDQSAAYATGVMVLICSACVAVVIDRYRKGSGPFLLRMPWPNLVITLIFFYTATAIMIEKPEGLKISLWFVAAILMASLFSRYLRATELRFSGFEFVNDESRFLWDSMKHLEFPVLVPHRPGGRTILDKEDHIRRIHRLQPDVPIVFIEAEVGDPSEFQQIPLLELTEDQGRFVLRVTRCASIAHVIAAIALELSKSGRPPELHFGWSDESPISTNLRFIMFGEGNVPWLVRKLIINAQPDPERQPLVVIG